jgi:adenosine kinase
LFGLGNPLLDIICTVDKDFLESYGLEANNAILADERHMNLCSDMIAKYRVEYLAGGAVQNTLRVAQWMLAQNKCSTFMGAIGSDDFGERMAKKAAEDGVNAVYMIDSSVSTGTCACLITDNGRHRSLCAYLGASQKFNIKHLLDNYHLVEKARVFYTSGFHLVVSPDSILNIANHVHNSEDKLFCMNLSAPYISQCFSKPLLEVFPFVDILFGNETEAQAFADLNGWKV